MMHTHHGRSTEISCGILGSYMTSDEMSAYLHKFVFSQQVNGQTSSEGTAVKVTTDSPLLEKTPAKKEQEVVAVVCNGELGLHEHRGLCKLPQRSQSQTVTKFTDLEKGSAELRKQADFVEVSDTKRTMLSSTVVTVLAPHWSGLLRRNKRFEGTGTTEAKDGTNNSEHRTQETADMSESSQAQLKVPLMATRWNTVGGSTKSTTSLGNEPKRSIIQTGSLDANLGRIDNLKREAGVLDTEQRRNPQTGLQEGVLSLGSKPMTSSLLLSLRSSNSRNPAATPHLSEIKPLSPSTLQGDQMGLKAHQESKPLFSPPSVSYRTAETASVLSPSFIENRERTAFETRFFSMPPINKDASYTQQSQIALTSSVSSPRNSPYDHSQLQKRPPVPRTTLTSTSWWKQVTQDSSSPSTNINDKPNTPLVLPYNDKGGLASPRLNDSQRLNGQIHTNRGTPDRTLRKTEQPPDQRSDRFVKQQYVFNLNTREPQKSHSLAGVSTASKISRTTPQIMTHPNNLPRHNVSSLAANLNELPPSLLSLKSTNTPTDSSTKYNNHSSAGNLAALQANIHPVSCVGSSSQPSKLTKTVNTTPLGFERSYASIPKPLRPKSMSSLISPVSDSSKTNYSPVTTAYTALSSTSNSPPATIAAPSKSRITQPSNPTHASSPTTIISPLLTPPATPIITNPNYSNPSSPREGRTLSSDQEKDTKKQSGKGEGKKARRVTWDDSVDLQCFDSDAVAKTEQPQVPSPTRSSVTIKAPSIFSFLRSSSPPTNTTPLCSPVPKTSSIQVAKAGNYRSLSSDAADLASKEQKRSQQTQSECLTSDQRKQDFSMPTHERTLSMESGTTQYRSSAPLSLPPDFSSSYTHRYSSPPYSTLMSSRSTQGETVNHKTITPRLLIFQQSSQSNHKPHNLLPSDPVKGKALPVSGPSLSPMSLQEPLSFHSQNTSATKEGFKSRTFDTGKLENNHSKSASQDSQKDKISLVNNRVHVYSQSLPGDKVHGSSRALVTETLVYSFKPKGDLAPAAPKSTTLNSLQHTPNAPMCLETRLSQQSQIVQSKEAASRSHQGSSSGSSTGSHTPDNERSKSKVKDSVLCKSRFFSMESSNEQSPKKGRFALKKSVSTPSSTLSRSDSDRSNKSNNKMDMVFNKLKQTFSTRRSDDDTSFPWKWKKASQTPSVSGSSDISNVCDVAVESAKTVEKQQVKKDSVPTGNDKETKDMNRWSPNRYTLVPPSAPGVTMVQDVFYSWPDKPTPNSDQDKQINGEEIIAKKQTQLTHSPTAQQFDFYDGSRTDYKPTNQFLSYRDPSPGRSPNPSAAHPTQLGKPTSSPRSPFSPFSSLSPLSSFPATDVTDDSVFYSPKLQRRKDSSSPCEPVEGFSLGGSRRSRASTGPPSASPLKDKEGSPSSYADLKYGIEPGRSFSVSSVLSCRPSRPGRISTGSRFMSVGDLTESALTCAGNDKDLDMSVAHDWTTQCNQQPNKDLHKYYANDSSKIRSRSLPRSLTKCLANWSPVLPPGNNITSNPAHLWNPSRNISQFAWETEGPPTPPPTPPLSPVVRRMSKPASLSSPTFPGPSGATQQTEPQSSRGHSLSRTYLSSLSTFEESSDSSSDTTTDDEYYLETGDGEEKETEL